MVIKQSELSFKKKNNNTFINSEIQTLNDSNFTDWVRTVAQWIVAHRAVVHRTVADQTVDHLLSTLQITMPRKKKRRKKKKESPPWVGYGQLRRTQNKGSLCSPPPKTLRKDEPSLNQPLEVGLSLCNKPVSCFVFKRNTRQELDQGESAKSSTRFSPVSVFRRQAAISVFFAEVFLFWVYSVWKCF